MELRFFRGLRFSPVDDTIAFKLHMCSLNDRSDSGIKDGIWVLRTRRISVNLHRARGKRTYCSEEQHITV